MLAKMRGALKRAREEPLRIMSGCWPDFDIAWMATADKPQNCANPEHLQRQLNHIESHAGRHQLYACFSPTPFEQAADGEVMGLGGLGPCRALARRPEPVQAGQTSGTDWGPSFLKMVRPSDMAAAQGPAQGNRASLPPPVPNCVFEGSGGRFLGRVF